MTANTSKEAFNPLTFPCPSQNCSCCCHLFSSLVSWLNNFTAAKEQFDRPPTPHFMQIMQISQQIMDTKLTC